MTRSRAGKGSGPLKGTPMEAAASSGRFSNDTNPEAISLEMQDIATDNKADVLRSAAAADAAPRDMILALPDTRFAHGNIASTLFGDGVVISSTNNAVTIDLGWGILYAPRGNGEDFVRPQSGIAVALPSESATPERSEEISSTATSTQGKSPASAAVLSDIVKEDAHNDCQNLRVIKMQAIARGFLARKDVDAIRALQQENSRGKTNDSLGLLAHYLTS